MTVVIATTPGREDWLAQCLASIDRPTVVLSDFTFELGKIRWVYDNTTVDRFMFLQDSVVVKDQALFNLLDEPGSIALTADPRPFGMYMGVYERNVLAQIEIPLPQSKQESIEREISWTEDYCRHTTVLRTAYPELTDRNAVREEQLFGRNNLVLENEHLIKYKGTWH